MVDWRKEYFDDFLPALTERLNAGEVEYGNESFDKPLPTTLHEIREEILDQAAWSFIACVRINRLLEAASVLGEE